ncbi:MAG: glycosyltransferase family 4 protein [Verrucomicrobiota bacterium]|nr:glycosyltransferase family 4 protein [Verrucomicrobiota bacterium]
MPTQMIYLVSHFYLPLGNPPASRMGHLARILVERYGRDNARVVTGRPNYPEGRLPPEYRWRLFRRTVGPAGEDIAHLYEIATPFQGFRRKTVGYLSFAVSVFFYFLFRRLAPSDLILVTSGPVFPAYAVYFLSRLKRHLRYAVDVRDLSPQTVPGMGFMNRESALYRALKRLSDRTYRRAVKTVGVVPGICEYLNAVAAPRKAALIYNPVDTREVRPLPEQDVRAFRQEHSEIFGDPGRTVFLYAGLHSPHLDLMTLLKALTHVKAETSAFVFVLIGHGEETPALKRFAAENGLAPNVCFLNHMPREQLVRYMNAADFCYFGARADPVFDIAVAVKAIEYLACGKFVVTAHGGAFPEGLRERKLGLISPPSDPGALARNLIALIREPGPYLGSRGDSRRFILERFSLKEFEKRYLTIFEDLVPPPRQPLASPQPAAG